MCGVMPANWKPRLQLECVHVVSAGHEYDVKTSSIHSLMLFVMFFVLEVDEIRNSVKQKKIGSQRCSCMERQLRVIGYSGTLRVYQVFLLLLLLASLVVGRLAGFARIKLCQDLPSDWVRSNDSPSG